MTDFGVQKNAIAWSCNTELDWSGSSLLFSLLHVFAANCADIIMPLQWTGRMQSCLQLAVFKQANPHVKRWLVPPCLWQQDILSVSHLAERVFILDYFGCLFAFNTYVRLRERHTQRLLALFLLVFSLRHLLLFRVKWFRAQSNEVILIKSVMRFLCSGGFGGAKCVRVGGKLISSRWTVSVKWALSNVRKKKETFTATQLCLQAMWFLSIDWYWFPGPFQLNIDCQAQYCVSRNPNCVRQRAQGFNHYLCTSTPHCFFFFPSRGSFVRLFALVTPFVLDTCNWWSSIMK